MDNDVCCTPPPPVAPDDVNLDDDNIAADRDLKLHGVNPSVAPVRAAVRAAKEVIERNALDGVANVANVVEIPPPKVRAAVDATGRCLLEDREGIL